LRNGRIVIKFHTENTTTLSSRAQFSSITEHFAKWNHGTHSLCIPGTHFHTLDASAAAVDLTNHIPEVIIGNNNFDFHNRFKQNR